MFDVRCRGKLPFVRNGVSKVNMAIVLMAVHESLLLRCQNIGLVDCEGKL
jgi:hypothetical protein